VNVATTEITTVFRERGTIAAGEKSRYQKMTPSEKAE
jgi:hypothetical protein